MFLVIISLFSIRCLVFGVPDLIPVKGQTLQQGLCGFQAFSDSHNVTETYDPWTTSVLVKNLRPSTLYTVYLTITVHGGQFITSKPMSAQTLDGGQCYMYLIYDMI